MPDVRFDIAPYAFAAASELSAELGCSHALAQVLVRRGLADPVAARAFLAADTRHPLEAFGGLLAGAELVLGHVKRGSRITVHGDYDVDGVTSTAILVRVLRTLGARVDWHLPSRTEDGYGLAAHTVDRLAARGTRLLITADCAITAVDEVARARAAGMDVLVTDHHAPRADGVLPEAPIVHPRLGRNPCEDLCAAGVALKLAGALLQAAGLDPALADEDLDLVALGTVADVVPLHDENRALVRAGLRALATTRKPGLRALLAVARVDPSAIDATTIGFRLGPRLNAAGRIARADAALELLLTGDPARAEAIAAELDRLNLDRRETEQRIRFEAEAMVRELGDRPAYVLAGEGWHPGVIGIVASRIAELTFRPTVLIALDGDEGTGSGRSIPAFDLLGGLEAGKHHLLRHGGHRAAAGCTIARDSVDGFREAFEAHAAEVLAPEDLVRVERVDAVVGGDHLGLDLAEDLARLEPFGAANPPVTLLVPAATVCDPRPLGAEGKHLAFSLRAGGTSARAVRFGAGDTAPCGPDEPVDVALRLEVNHFNGTVEPRVVVRRIRPSAAASGVGGVAEVAAGVGGVVDAAAGPAGTAEAAAGVAGAVDAARGVGGVRVVGEDDFEAGVRAELEAPLTAWARRPSAADVLATPGLPGRRHRDVCGQGVAGVLADLAATGERVLVVCAHAPHRAASLGSRLAGLDVVAWGPLLAEPELAAPYGHVVALDPPPLPEMLRGLEHLPGAGWTHRAWGAAELDVARAVHAWKYAQRDTVADVYRALRAMARRPAGAPADGTGSRHAPATGPAPDGAGSRDAPATASVADVAGDRLRAALRGGGPQPRTAAMAGRALRVLAELDLVTVRPDGELRVALVDGAERTSLDASEAFRTYERRLADGFAWLDAPAARAA